MPPPRSYRQPKTRSAVIIAMALSARDESRIHTLEIPSYERTGTSQGLVGEIDLDVLQRGLQSTFNLPNDQNVMPSVILNSEIQNTDVSSSVKTDGRYRRSKRLVKKIKRNLFNTDGEQELEEPYVDSGSEYVPSDTHSEHAFSETHSEHISSETHSEYASSVVFADDPAEARNSSEITVDLNHENIEQIYPCNSPDRCMLPSSSSNIISQEVLPMEKSNNTVCSSSTGPTISVTKKIGDKRIRDKRHCCYFCQKILTNNMARHFEVIHGKELEVARILAFPKNSLKRRNELQNLINAGDFYYNCNALATKTGELILLRRPQQDILFSYTDFGPCTHCLGFMSKKYLWHHVKNCKKNSNTNNAGKGPSTESSALVFGIIGPKSSEEFSSKILATLRGDRIGDVAKDDLLIVKAGEFLFDSTKNHVESTRQGMRQLARLKIELNNMVWDGKTVNNLRDWIVPKFFDKIISATRSISIEEGRELSQKVPSLALKIGQLLRVCIKVETGYAIRNSFEQRRKQLQEFLELMNIEWYAKISSKALSVLAKRKMNSAQLLPLTSDLIKLNVYLQQQMRLYKSHVMEKCNRQSWNSLASVTLTRIILFNKRRSGEASKMTLNDFANRPSWAEQGTEEFKNSLSKMELELASRLTVVEIIGKRGRKVPVLLTPDVKFCIELLITKREEGNILPTNQHIFARSQGSEFNIRGHDCLRKLCVEAGLVSAENITSTKLRKYIATVCQIFDLKEHECDWLAKHLGHDIRVHRDFYRLHESAAELTKISRLLIAVDNGEAQKFSGKQLADINIQDLPPLEIDEEIQTSHEDYHDALHSTDLNIDIELPTTTVMDTMNVTVPENNYERPKKKPSKRKMWSKEENEYVLTTFKHHIKAGTLPGKPECEETMEKFPLLKERKWTDLKFFIKNYLSKYEMRKNMFPK